MTEGPGVFTTPETASAPSPTANPRALRLAADGHEHGPVRPVASSGEETSDTPVADPSASSRSRTFVRAVHDSRPLRAKVWGGRGKSPPRPPSSPVRENQRFETTRGAFVRQGPFARSGGHYRPGLATVASPFGRVRRPLDDALTSPWAFSRSRSVVSEATRDGDCPFRSAARPRRVTVVGRRDLGPRSLAPAALFGARLTSFFETRVSPADFCNCIRRAGTNLEL